MLQFRYTATMQDLLVTTKAGMAKMPGGGAVGALVGPAGTDAAGGVPAAWPCAAGCRHHRLGSLDREHNGFAPHAILPEIHSSGNRHRCRGHRLADAEVQIGPGQRIG